MRQIVIASIAALGIVGAGCADPGPPNLIIVSVDTLRADALGAYGGPIPTPAFDQLLAQGVLFEQAIAPAPETAASYATLFTGNEVQHHGVIQNGASLASEVATLAEAFRNAGYQTGAFVSSFVLDPRFGWDQGFEHYDAKFSKEGETVHNRGGFWAQHEFDGFDRRAVATNAAAIPWLRSAREPFLLFVHYFDPHAPNLQDAATLSRVPTEFAQRLAADWIQLLEPKQRRKQAELRQFIRAYYAEVLATDAALGELLAAVDSFGLSDRTIVAVTADHGEGLGQHGLLDHAAHLYDEQLRVPLLLRWTGVLPTGKRVRDTVGLVDLAPTLADLAGVAFPGADVATRGAIDGRSHAGALRAGRRLDTRPVLARRRNFPIRFQGELGAKFSVRTDRWKYIRSTDGPDELYDLEVDRGELHNVLDHQTEPVALLGAVLDAHLSRYPIADRAPELDPEERRALEAMGYETL